MKYALLFCAGLCFSVFANAQQVKTNPGEVKKFDNQANIKANPHGDQKFDDTGNKLKVTLSKDRLFVTDKDLLVPVASLQALDSLIKKLPDPKNLTIHLETENAEAEKIRAVTAVL